MKMWLDWQLVSTIHVGVGEILLFGIRISKLEEENMKRYRLPDKKESLTSSLVL